MQKKAVVFIMLAGVLWATIGMFVRYFAEYGFSSLELVSIRAFISLIVFGLYILIRDRSLFRIRLRDIWMFAGSGMLCFVGFNMLYFNTIQLTSLSVAAILLYTSPIFVVLFSALFFKERLTGRKLLCLLLSFAGSVLVSGIFKNNASITALGFIMGLGSGLGYGLYSIFSRFGLMRYDTLTVTFYTFVFAVIGCILTTDVPLTLSKIDTPQLAVIAVVFGIVTSVLPYLFYNTGLRYTETGKAAIFACIEPVMATVFSIAVMREPFDIIMAAGIVLVLLAIILLNTHAADKA